MGKTAKQATGGLVSVAPLMRPESIALVGASPDPRSIGGAVLGNFQRFGYGGKLHFVSRSKAEINGTPCFPTIADLPEGVDCVVLVVPEAAVLDSVKACIARQVRSAMVFAAGFSETGAEGAARQKEMETLARNAGLALAGPNCIGLTNYVGRVPLTFEPIDPQAALNLPGVAVLAQSGGMSGNIRSAIMSRNVSITHVISTGNEAVCRIEDFLAFLVDDPDTAIIALFVEQLRRPDLFLQLAQRAREKNKPLVLMHPGASARARDAALSHTGALAGDHAVMGTLLTRAGVLVVDTLDELVDVTAILAHRPQYPDKGPGVLTNSGAFRGIALDFCEERNLDLPNFAPQTVESLRGVLPAYAAFDNPVDVTTAGMTNPDIFGQCARRILDDPHTGSLLVTIMGGGPRQQVEKVQSLAPVLAAENNKSVALTILGDELPLAEDAVALIRKNRIPFFRSPDRAMRALSAITSFGRISRFAPPTKPKDDLAGLAANLHGAIPEHRAKALLRQIGISVPLGELASTADEAGAIAARLGYPVALKAQAAELSHKSDAGGVALNIAEPQALQTAWAQMQESLKRANFHFRLDGVLVEKMGARGLETIVGAKRDLDWGPVLMVGLGGVLAEALKDVRLLPADAGADWIAAELDRLRAATLLKGFRGEKPVDRKALISVLQKLGDLMRANPNITEIEINPLVVYPEGRGALALDALMVVSNPDTEGPSSC